MHDRYHVDPNPPLSPPGTPPELLEPLAAALNACEAPVQRALDELTPEMVELTFNSLSPKQRQRLLHLLGIKLAAPRRASKSLCADMLTRMRRELKQHGCTCAAGILTDRVVNDVSHAVWPTSAQAPVVDPMERWTPALVRLAVFARCQASALDAGVLLWAADHAWLGLGEDSKELDAVREAAEAVIEGLRASGWTADGRSLADADEPSTPDSGSGSLAETARTAGRGTADPAVSGELDPADVDQDDNPDAAYESLLEVISSASAAVRRISEALGDGFPPLAGDLRELARIAPAFTRTQEALEAVGQTEIPAQREEIARAVEAHRALRRRDTAARERLRALLTITGGGAAAGSLAAAHERARQLLQQQQWDSSLLEQSRALAALVEIVELSGTPSALSDIMERQQLVGRTLPDCGMAALMYTELAFPDAAAASLTSTVPTTATVAVESSTLSSPTTWGDTTVRPTDEERAAATPLSSGLAVPTPELSPGTGTADGDEAEARVTDPAGAGPHPADAAIADTIAAPENAPRVPRQPGHHEGTAAPTAAPHRPVGSSSSVHHLAAAERTEVTVSDDAVESAVARLVAERRFGLAARLSDASGASDAESTALYLAAAADVLVPGSGSGTRAVSDALQQWDTLGVRGTEGTELLLLPALVRTALITGEHVTGAQLRALAPRLPACLAEIAVTVGDRALSGALLIARPMSVIAGVSATESGLREVTEQCRALLKPPRLRFNRATHIAKKWLAEGGMLGAMLLAVTHDVPDAHAVVRDTAERLSRLSEIQAEIDKADREQRGSSGRPLQGSGRQDLVHVIERSVDCAKAWLHVKEALERRKTTEGSWAAQEIAAMRESVLARQAGALAELERASHRPHSLAAASARAAHHSLTELFLELEDGARAQRSETTTDAREVIDAELLKIPRVPDRQPHVQDLLAAVDRTWEEALTLQAEQDDFRAAWRILDLAALGALPGEGLLAGIDGARTELVEFESRRRSELAERREELLAELRGAQADGALSDDQDVALQELLADSGTETAEQSVPRELSLVRRNLDLVAKYLPQYRKEAADRLRARLAALPKVTAGERAQVLRHLDTDGLATAADLVYFLELGEQVPEILTGDSHLGDFFPAVPAGLPEGVSKTLVHTVQQGGQVAGLPVLDFARLSTDEAARAADALERWRQLASWEPKDRQNAPTKDLLLPALSLLGYEARKARPLYELPRSHEYRFVDVSEIQINGRAWAPAFGSKITEQGGTLRVLMVWGRPSAQLLLSRATQEPSGESLLIAYFGTLGSEERAALAANVGRAPLMVVDDAALAYLAARGNRQVSAATETLLPFSGINPYIKEKRGRIGREMFYGRDAERKSILDPAGTQIIFGGRGLGKSALLNDAGDRFSEQQPTYHRPVYINLDHHNIGKGTALGPDTIWNVLDAELTSHKVLVPRTRRQSQSGDPFERVRAGVKSWLDDEAQHRLLILMDECDRFFEADAPYFTQTRRLKLLCEENRGRVKVVFAGLHSVQRYTRLARNQPFSHLAQTPTVVGPLAPQFAADLLALPMRALGFEFADVDLVNRVLGYCSYQPFLLQMFGSRLVEAMQRKRARREVSGLPYVVEAEDVQAVESDLSLRADITAAFKDTLTLDDRYNVIANVLARHARDNGLEARFTDIELRDECTSWWRAGFQQLDSEGFRAYLQEMVGLGILAPNHDGRGWHLRGPNALRMIGTAQEVETSLLSAENECRMEETVVMEGRPELPARRPSPLTLTQVNDLLGDHANQRRIVFGTAATGIGDVSGTLRTITGTLGWKMPPVGTNRVFRQELATGRPGERRVVLSDLAALKVNEAVCRESMELAVSVLPDRPGVTRAVVLVTGPGQLGLWRELLSDSDTAASAAVVLRRYDRHSAKAWTQHGHFLDTEERQHQLWEATGGWPFLLDRVVALHEAVQDQDEALRRLTGELHQRISAFEFVEAAGLTADPLVTAAYRAAAEEFGTAWTDDGDLLAAIELAGLSEADARWAHTCLDTFQVFEQEGTKRRLEPVLYGAWSRT